MSKAKKPTGGHFDLTVDEARKQFPELFGSAEKPKSKMGNKFIVIDGIKFRSKREGNRYSELKLREKAGQISELRLQVRHPIIIGGIKVTTYVSDFEYLEAGRPVVEDCKGFRDKLYKIKNRLMKALFGITILET